MMGGGSAIHIKTCRQDIDCGGPLYHICLNFAKVQHVKYRTPSTSYDQIIVVCTLWCGPVCVSIQSYHETECLAIIHSPW